MNAAIICIVVLLSTSGASHDSNLSNYPGDPPATDVTPPATPPVSTTPAAPVTTPAPPVTTPAAPVTTLAPPVTTPTTPVPPPTKPTTPAPEKVGQWKVTDDSGVVCILLEMKAEFNIEYESTNVSEPGLATIHVPATANATGRCGEPHQPIDILWPHQYINLTWKDSAAVRSLVIQFQLVNMTEESYVLSDVQFAVDIDPENFPNAASTTGTIIVEAVNSTEFLDVLPNHSYSCESPRELELYYNSSQVIHNQTYIASVKFSDMKMEAFRTKSNTEFGKATVCAADSEATSDIVPIAVGCALAALVVIVVIAYLISRKKVRSEYQAM